MKVKPTGMLLMMPAGWSHRYQQDGLPLLGWESVVLDRSYRRQ